MAISAVEKKTVVGEHQKHTTDTGSSEVQIALLTTDIKQLTEHFKIHKKDAHSRRGLLRKVNTRNSLLKYLKRTHFDRYIAIVKKLGLRHAGIKKATAAE